MDEYSGKRHAVIVHRKGSGFASRTTTDKTNQDGQFCNRIGCSGRLKYSKAVCLNEKPKYSRPSSCSPNDKEVAGSSSRNSKITNARKSIRESQRKCSSHLETDVSESSSTQGEPNVPELISSPSTNQTGFQADVREARSGKVALTQVASSSIGSDSKSVRVFGQKYGSGSLNTPGSSASTASNTTVLGARKNTNGSRYGLGTLKCNSISDVIPRAGSPSKPKISRKDSLRKRIPEGESSSSSKGKRITGATSEDGHVSNSASGISIPCSRRTRNWASSNDSTATSPRTRRSMNVNSRMRFSNHDGSDVSSLADSNVVIPQLRRPDTLMNTSVNSLSYQSSAEASSSHSRSYSISGRSGDNSPGSMLFASLEHGVTHALWRYNLDGVAEMLMALERIEQDEELNYEQLLALETNLFLGSLNMYDQHREMRLDIDNMSYEELLALEERMGNVSTALSDEALAKCLRLSMYQTPSFEVGFNGCGDDKDDVKCSICQDEYVIGDEIGKLVCDHGYHFACIQQWLRLKNWCPICKASAATSPSSSPL